MTERQSSNPRPDPQLDPLLAQDIAQETGAPLSVVQHVFREEAAALAEEATVTQFIQVIARRRAWLRLRTQ